MLNACFDKMAVRDLYLSSSLKLSYVTDFQVVVTSYCCLIKVIHNHKPCRTVFFKNCNNSTYKCKASGVKVQFFNFPKDVETRKLWIASCGQEADIQPKTHHRVCSNHFLSTEYTGVPTSTWRELAVPKQHIGN